MFELKAKHTHSSSHPLVKGILPWCVGGNEAIKTVVQSSGEDQWDSLQPGSAHQGIRAVFKGLQEQQSNLTNHPLFSVLLSKLPHHSAWKTRIYSLLISLPRLNPFGTRPKSHPSSDTIGFSEEKTSQGKSNKSGGSSSWTPLQQMYFPGK